MFGSAETLRFKSRRMEKEIVLHSVEFMQQWKEMNQRNINMRNSHKEDIEQKQQTALWGVQPDKTR